jgi:integrase
VRSQVAPRVKELLVKAGLTGFSLHSLRHSFASIHLSSGTPIPVVSQMLGHSDPNIMLGIYSHVLPTDPKAAMNRWRDALAEEDRVKQNLKKSTKI